MDGKKQGMTKEMKTDLKRYLESQGIQNPNMESTEEGRKQAKDLIIALNKMAGK